MSVFSIIDPYGMDLFCLGKKFLVFNLVSRNLKTKYRRSILGVFWTLLNPIAMAMVYYFVFKIILNVKVPHYLSFILSGVLPWVFFSQSLLENMESIVANWGLVSKVPIPLQIFPFIGTLTNLVTLGFAFPVLVCAAFVSGVTLGPSLILLPVYFIIMFLITYGLSLILSVAFVYFRDLRHIMGIVTQIWFYSTPVLYDEAMIPEKYRWILWFNPVGYIFTEFHTILVKGQWPSSERVLVSMFWVLFVVAMAGVVKKFFCSELVEQI